MISEYEQYYEVANAQHGADPDPEQCGCHGNGYFLSEIDTIHECRFHYDGQPHPEYSTDEDYDTYYGARARRKYKAIAQKTCRTYNVTSEVFNRQASEALQAAKDFGRINPDNDQYDDWVDAAREVFEAYEEVKGPEAHR